MKGTFHGFTIQEKIGAGGMSTVYKGVHTTLGYPVAIKLLHVELADDEIFIGRFEREAKTAANLHNNNIASVIDFGVSDDRYFIVMEYVDGRDFHEVMEQMAAASPGNRALPVEISLSLIESVAYGLQAAHGCKVIHRDIKPRNLMLRRDGEVKIVDFGLARDAGQVGGYTLTNPGMVAGTVAYMSPEQARGENDLGPQSDIFSLGITLFELLTGERPFVGDTLSDVQYRISQADAPPLTKASCPMLTDDVVALASKMLARNPVKRFESMDQVLRAIDVCWERLDHLGFTKHRREFMRQFAADPSGFAKSLRQKNIKIYLNRGINFETMGVEKFGDAIEAFDHVLALDPKNRQAAVAVRKIRRKLGESAERLASGERQGNSAANLVPPSATLPSDMPFDATSVLDVVNEKPRRPARGWAWGSIPAVVILGAISLWLFKPALQLRTASAPEFSVTPGTYSTVQAVRITCDTEGATIRYTTDGVDPAPASAEYRTPVLISASTTLKAIAYARGYRASAITSADYTVVSRRTILAFHPSPGSFGAPQDILISGQSAEDTVWFTLDGSDPTRTAQRYHHPIGISTSSELRAFATRGNGPPSNITSGIYTIASVLPPPKISPASGAYAYPMVVTITCNDAEATIHYTTDGHEPTESSTPYRRPVEITSPKTLKAVAFRAGFEPSAVTRAVYRDVIQPAEVAVRFRLTRSNLVRVNGTDFGEKQGDVSLSLAPGSTYEIVVCDPRNPRCESRVSVRLIADSERDLGNLDPPCGTLDVLGVEGMSITIDQTLISASNGEAQNVAIPAGDHEISFTLKGYQATRAAMVVNGELVSLPLASGSDRYRFSVKNGQHHKITCQFLPKGD